MELNADHVTMYVHATDEYIISTLEDAGFNNLSLGRYEPQNDQNGVFWWIRGTAQKY